MNRLHLHIHVDDLSRSVEFYSDMFGERPSVVKQDYAKWLIDNPAINLAISTYGSPGLSHLGLQADSEEELSTITHRLQQAGREYSEEHNTTCCYAVSDKTWVTDPAGLRWDTFHTKGSATVYSGGSSKTSTISGASGCCISG